MSEPAKINAALLAARLKMEPPSKTATNPHFKSKYAPLDELVRVSLGPLSEVGLMVTQHTVCADGHMMLCTKILSKDGETMSCGEYDLGPLTTPQAMGSAITYARRYTLAAILGLAAEDDDDGNAGSQQPTKPTASTSRPASRPAAPSPKSLDRAGLEADYVEAWRSTQTKEKLADPDNWKARGAAVKTILGLDRYIRLSDMTDDQIRLCIAEWTGGGAPPADDDLPF